MKLFAKVVNGFHSLTTFTKSSMLDDCLGSECASDHTFAITHKYHEGFTFAVSGKMSRKAMRKIIKQILDSNSVLTWRAGDRA